MDECTHDTMDDHSVLSHAGIRFWTCSVCGSCKTWDDGHEYLGSIECKKCWRASIDRVTCSDECKARDKENRR